MSILSKAIYYWREQGIRALMRRARQAIWHTEPYVIVRKRLEVQPVEAQCGDVVFRPVEAGDVAWLAEQWPGHFEYVGPDVQAVLNRRLEGGEIGVIGVPSGSEDELACMIWFGFRDFAMLTVCGPEPTCERGCAKNLWTAPEHRRKGLARGIQKYLEALVAQRGCRDVWGFVKPSNAASFHHLGQLGYKEYGKALFLQRWGRMSARVIHAGGTERREICPSDAAIL